MQTCTVHQTSSNKVPCSSTYPTTTIWIITVRSWWTHPQRPAPSQTYFVRRVFFHYPVRISVPRSHCIHINLTHFQKWRILTEFFWLVWIGTQSASSNLASTASMLPSSLITSELRKTATLKHRSSHTLKRNLTSTSSLGEPSSTKDLIVHHSRHSNKR